MMTEMDAVLSANLPLMIGVVALLGLLVGSFLNVVIHRLPKMLEQEWQLECALLSGQPAQEMPRFNLLTPASHCPSCQAPVRAWHNIPVLSFLLLRGRCHSCKATIARRYPLVELMCGVMFAALAYRFGWTLDLLGYAALTATLIALAFIDADTQLLPDSLTLPLLWGGLLFSLLGGRVPLDEAVIGAMLGYVSLWVIFWLFKLATGKEGMGYGDFKLLAALGAWLGWKMLPLVILLSSLVGAVFGIAMILMARLGRGQHLPFGPYLALAGWIALLWGEQIVGWYLGGR
ncbi:prepilin peptidase [Pseudogulbenkiania ferrooxidans]|uniref:Prepilin leader peptidase/N-methyltransferase n=1 Tax=Pseudogulbenkiania ferrooxidans 2002 TaxID=279714 RepID=B9YZC2_9NEIS|nr:A24 family peptidase [Pseudogulbenkiania ferrooxidans]EEG10475.1 Prepilin peptidase [Pseudogulbenkiania ferrooxidans 2002]